VLASIPQRLYGWDWRFPECVEDGWVKGTIHLNVDWDVPENGILNFRGDVDFVGVKWEDDLWSAGHAAWGTGPRVVIAIKHPDSNVPLAIKNWMRRNKVNWAIMYHFSDITRIIVIRYNYTSLPDTDEYRNKNDAYSTLIYEGRS
jgi:hypothetical protein